MREKILSYLNQAIIYYKEILSANKLPPNLLSGSKHTVENDIPRHLSNFITVINMVDKAQSYPLVNNIDNGIIVFSNTQLDVSIEHAIIDNNIVGIGGSPTNMTAKGMLDYSVEAVRSSVELLQLQVALTKLMR